MTTNTTKMIPPKQPQSALAEAAYLLGQLSFSEGASDARRGDTVSVAVEPELQDDSNSLSALITCFAHGLRQVDWQQLLIVVRQQTPGDNLIRIRPLDRRGQTLLPNLPADGTYIVTVQQRSRIKQNRNEADLLKLTPRSPRSVRLEPQNLAAAGKESKQPPPKVSTYAEGKVLADGNKGKQSPPEVSTHVDGKLEATLWLDTNGNTVLGFETTAPDLANTRIMFILINEADGTEHDGEVRLREMPGGDRWHRQTRIARSKRWSLVWCEPISEDSEHIE